METRIRNDAWKDDETLKEELKVFVSRRYSREEIILIVRKKYKQYAWSLRTLGNRLAFFSIKYNDNNTLLREIYNKVDKELNGPGCKLGYRAMTKKFREIHNLNVPRDVVYHVMQELDPEGLEARGGVGKSKRRPRKKRFISRGSNCTMSLDGHDKLCGFQKSMFPLHIYGGQDCFSGKITFLRVWTSNNNPKVIGRMYFDYLSKAKFIPDTIRVDRGTETDEMAALHCFLHQEIYDYGTTEQLLDRCVMDIMAYIFIPVIQKELDIFRQTVWNYSRGRKQESKELPTGIPEIIFDHPEEYGGEQCGTPIILENIRAAGEEMGYDDDFDYLEPNVRAECGRWLPNTNVIEPEEVNEAFVYLKDNFSL